jgi:hypothetical protein
MWSEPEALTEAEQQRQTQEARARWRREQARAWGRARVEILGAVEHVKASSRPDRQLLDDLRGIERQVVRTDRHVAELGRGS